ncbi:hypothetical protein U1Q18_037160 [Sarracenia purpurea var. burkii]
MAKAYEIRALTKFLRATTMYSLSFLSECRFQVSVEGDLYLIYSWISLPAGSLDVVGCGKIFTQEENISFI